jgi:hypothetical protein
MLPRAGFYSVVDCSIPKHKPWLGLAIPSPTLNSKNNPESRNPLEGFTSHSGFLELALKFVATMVKPGNVRLVASWLRLVNVVHKNCVRLAIVYL